MPLIHRRLSCKIAGLMLLAACGPQRQGAEPGTGDSSSASSGGTAPETSTGEPDDDVSWLVGKYTSSCLPYPDPPFVHGCRTDTSYELEFHADGRMTSTRVFCGMSTTQVETGVYRPGSATGEALIEPDAGFDYFYVIGQTAQATARKTDDCMIIEVSTVSTGTVYTGYFVRGEFQYVPEEHGCTTEVVATAVPECP